MKRLTFLLICLAAALPAAASAHRGRGDHDGMPNGWEKRYHLNPRVNDARRDPDRDGLENLAEFRHHTNPRKADTDGDGLKDGDEVRTHNNPRKDDTDHDGNDDGDANAGTVASFDGSVLTIDLANGDTLTGKVTDATEITCEASADTGDDHGRHPGHGRASRGGSDDGPGDDADGSSGREADDAPGDDRGEHLGDDRGQHLGDDRGQHLGDNRGQHLGDNRGQHLGEDHPHRRGDDAKRSCATSDLEPGTAVHEAELDGTGPDAVFHEVELVK